MSSKIFKEDFRNQGIFATKRTIPGYEYTGMIPARRIRPIYMGAPSPVIMRRGLSFDFRFSRVFKLSIQVPKTDKP
jgi:hypothetical protein